MPVLTVQTETNVQQPEVSLSKLWWVFAFFVVSGFCGLVYEVVWIRLAMASFGVTTALASIVISMFMAGLGLGSWGAGVLARRFLGGNGRIALRIYAIAELMVGVSSLAVPSELKLGRQLLQHFGSFGAWQSSSYYILAGIWIAIALVPWCACMGATFPLLMAVIRQVAKNSSERSFSYLYIANVIGALVGTIASAFVLIELLGFHGTLCVAGGLNIILALSAFAISIFLTLSQSVDKPAAPAEKHSNLYGLPKYAVLFLLFTTGLVSMGMEVVWIREFTPYLGNVVYAFASILAVYLMATVMGSLDYRSNAVSKRPEQSAGTWILLAFFAVLPVVFVDPLLNLGGHFDAVRLCGIGIFCALAGYLTPLLVDSWSSGDPGRAGTAYAVNIAGSIVGPLIAGFWLLPWLGERWAVFALSVPLFAIAGLLAFRKTSGAPPLKTSGMGPRLRFALITAVALLLFSVSHDFESIFTSRVVRRDYAATVIATGKGFDRIVLVNGVGMTRLTPLTKNMVHIPLALMSRPPQNGLVICFGMGTSFRSMLSWGIPTTAVDLIPSVPKLFWYFHDDAAKVASSPLAHIVIDDGRRFLDGSNQLYDVIVVDPPPPAAAAGSSLLYSREFYGVIKNHLRKDGILQIWYPLLGDAATKASIARALKESFPYVRAFPSTDSSGIYFLASMEPITLPASTVMATRMPAAAVSDLLEWTPQNTAESQFDSVLLHEVPLESLIAPDPRVPAIQDDQPINEYYLLRNWFGLYR